MKEFHIEKRDGVSVLVYRDGGCRPASMVEALQDAEIAIITKHRNRLIKLVDIQTAEIARLKEATPDLKDSLTAYKDALTAAHMDGFHEGQGQYRDKVRKLQDEIARLKEEATKREKRLEQIVQEQRDTIILFEKSHAALREKVEYYEGILRNMGFVI